MSMYSDRLSSFCGNVLFNLISGNNSQIKDKALVEKCGELWMCTARYEDEFGGYIYEMQLRPDYDDTTSKSIAKNNPQKLMEKLDEIFPAIEPVGLQLEFLIPSADILDLRSQTIEKIEPFLTGDYKAKLDSQMIALIFHRSRLNELGYKCEKNAFNKLTISLPDREALTARWERLRWQNNELPPLNIVSSEGIADDVTFVREFLYNDGLLSDQKEFVHDHIYHIIPLIVLMLGTDEDTTNYTEEKTRLRGLIEPIYLKLDGLKKNIKENPEAILNREEFDTSRRNLQLLEAALGALVDEISSSYDYDTGAGTGKYTKEYVSKYFRDIWKTSPWDRYWVRRFGKEMISDQSLSRLIEQINAFE